MTGQRETTTDPASGAAASAIERRYPPQTARLYFDLSVFWFALTFLWAGMITIVMQELVRSLVGEELKPLYLGWTLALGALVSTIVVIVTGAASDRAHWKMGRRRPYLIAGTVLSVPPLLWLASIHSIPALMLDFCLIQCWVNVATSPYQALIPDLVPKERHGIASAYMGVSLLLGQLAGLVACMALWLRPGGPLTVSLLFSSLLVLAMFYTTWRVKESCATANPRPRLSLLGTVKESFRVRPREHLDFFRLIASRFIINMGFYTATEFLNYYVRDTLRAPDPMQTLGIILVIATVSGLVGNVPAGLLADRLSKKRIIYVSTALTSLAALVFVLTNTVSVAYAAAVIFGAGYGAFAAVDWAFACNLLPDHDEAKHMGIWHVAFTAPQVAAPFLGGLVAYAVNVHWGAGVGYRVVLALVIGYLALGVLMIRPIREAAPPPKAT